METQLLHPDYRTSPMLTEPTGVRHGFFGRRGGVSTGMYASLNCGFGSGDDSRNVQQNRQRTARALGLPTDSVLTVYQVHGREVFIIDGPADRDRFDPPHRPPPQADAIVTTTPGIAIGILTADCVPILLTAVLEDSGAPIIGAAHAGWKGAMAGIAESTINAMIARGAARDSVRAAIGPSIRQASYEVDQAFFSRLTDIDSSNERFFIPGRAGHHHFDLPGYVEHRLRQGGASKVDDLAADTLADPEEFFSYRRGTLNAEPDYGRQMAVIGIAP